MANVITRGLSWYLSRYSFGEETGHTMKLRLYEGIAAVPAGGTYDYLYTNFTELTSCGGYTAGGKTLDQDGTTSWYLPAPSSTNGPDATALGYGKQYIQCKDEMLWTFTEEAPNTSHIPLGYYVVVQAPTGGTWYLLWYEVYTFPKAPMWNDTYKVTPRIEI
jgi:hypothetical protein